MRNETIVAPATPPGYGGVGILRLSGKAAVSIAEKMLGKKLSPRKPIFAKFLDTNGVVLDEGIVIYFANPNSYTGEDVVELQGHGSPIVMDKLVKVAVSHGAVLAKPGEFTERAFLNDKLDLVQAEAVADLIHASSEKAAKSAMASLQGEFSNQITSLSEAIIRLRVFVEATLDFPDEEIDFIHAEKVQEKLSRISIQLDEILLNSKQGSLLRDGLKVVLAGEPNVGKSSLLNALANNERAIVTDIPGTTRDVIRETILLDGLPVHIVDTAGIRTSADVVEEEGIRRALKEVEQADAVLFVVSADKDETELNALWPKEFPKPSAPVMLIRNKCDLTEHVIGKQAGDTTTFNISAKNKEGLTEVSQHLKQLAGFSSDSEGVILARRRHIDALEQAKTHLLEASNQILNVQAIELAAEELRLAHDALGTIVGTLTADDLLGEIFSTFCIGK